MTQQSRRNYWPLLALLAMAILPLAAAMLSYFGKVALPSGTVNSGELIVSQQSLEHWQLTDTRGEPWRGQGRWQLLLVVEKCQQDCQAWQHTLGQLHKALGRDRQRVEQQLVLPALVENQTNSLLSSIAQPSNRGVWLADPMGNLVLRYRLDQPPQDLFKDLKRLLKVSNVG
ncbi:MAG: hypothetical protein V7752_15875 [Halopseudomonas sp.]